MKIIALVVILTSCLFYSNLLSQDFSIAVSYLAGEKSKDSHSSSESFAIDGRSVAYSVKYSGRKGKNDIDMDKVCEFTEQNIENIKKTIISKELNVVDSLFQETSKTKSFEQYTNINIAIRMDGQDYKIRINGDILEFEDSKLYKNSLFFITLLRKMVKDCS